MSFLRLIFGGKSTTPAPTRQPPSPKDDPRSPDEMPTEWAIEWYERARSLGVLVRGEERVAFDGSHYSWDSQPEPGTPVSVSWKRSAMGRWNVPIQVKAECTELVTEPMELTPQAWLDGFHAASGKLSAITVRRLMTASENGGPLCEWLDDEGPFPAPWFMNVLLALEHAFEITYELRKHRGWLHVCTWHDDGMDASAEKLARMLGVAVPLGEDFDVNSFERYIAAFNRKAEGSTDQRLFIVDHVDSPLVVRLTVEAFEVLTAAGLLFAHAPLDGRK